MPRPCSRPSLHLVLAVLALAAALPARAHHRQTPPVVALTASGDTTLPRLPFPSRKAVALTPGTGTDVEVISPFRLNFPPSVVWSGGTNSDPSIGSSGRIVAWVSNADPLGNGAPGNQVIVSTTMGLQQAAIDETGTSADPAVDRLGRVVAFSSTGDLALTGNAGARQVFLRDLRGGVAQVSVGAGTSRHPSVGAKGRLVTYASTSDLISFADTGVSQIQLADRYANTIVPITAGVGPSVTPSLSDDDRVIAFASRADLAGDGHDTGTYQIFAYDLREARYARITNDVGGCTDPAVVRIQRDWRIGYRCGNSVYFTMLVEGVRWRVQTDGGIATGIRPQSDAHFLVVATDVNILAGSGTTTGERAYMVNLYKRPPEFVPGAIVWFPN